MSRAKPKTLRASVPNLRRIVKQFRPQLHKQRFLIGGASVGLFAEIGFRLVEPWPLKFVFDRVIVSVPTGGSSGVPAVDALSPMTLLVLCASAVVVIAAGRAMTAYVSRVGFALAGNRVLTESRSELFAHLQRLSLSFHNQSRTGDLITRITSDIGRLQEVLVTAALPLAAHMLMLVGMLLVMLFMEWRLGLIALAVLPLFMLTSRRLSGRIRDVARRQRQREGAMGATAAEAITSIRVVQALSLEDIHEQAFTAQNASSLKEGVKGQRLSARLERTVDVLIAFATAGVLLYGARLVMRGALTPGDLIVFLAYLKNAFKPMRDVAKYTGRIAKASASAERILEVFDIAPEVVDHPGAVEAPTEIERIRFSEVTFGYTPDDDALKRLTFEAERGQVIALAGPSGAGKTTVLSLLLRLFDPQDGSVLINGLDIRGMTVQSLRRRIAVVPQENVLFAVSVRENIAYGDPEATDEQIEQATRLACAHEFIVRLPQGYDTVVGERGQTLSEGQRQRLSIARAAVRGAPIMVLDEPTASLDNDNNQMIRKAIRRLSEGRITFIIAHDLSTVQEADQILVLDSGRLHEHGTHEQLMSQNGLYASLWALQMDGVSRERARLPHAVGR